MNDRHPDFKFEISDFRSQISDLRFQISDFRFQISDLRFQISDLESGYRIRLIDLFYLLGRIPELHPRKNCPKRISFNQNAEREAARDGES